MGIYDRDYMRAPKGRYARRSKHSFEKRIGDKINFMYLKHKKIIIGIALGIIVVLFTVLSLLKQ